jgi:solute carrier family 34 (sodium-dependent phosphate cotransporter)
MVRVAILIVGTLLLFLFAIELMVASLHGLERSVVESIVVATSNPFTALFIGLLVTALIQSSSTTTSMVVALVASSSITLDSAIPIIMGANIGTTITSTIVALGFMNKRKEFRRAVAAGSYHDFFNILTVIILFPLEYYYGFLSRLSSTFSSYFFDNAEAQSTVPASVFSQGFNPIVHWLTMHVNNRFLLVLLAFVLLFISILLFRKSISKLLLQKSSQQSQFFVFKNSIWSFVSGLSITAAIRSSTVTTSLVVPVVAKRIIKLQQAAPFILGANIGTTITAFIAALLYANTSSGITIAMAHFLFNLIGVLIFLPIPLLRKIPLDLARYLGKLTLHNRFAGLLYLLVTFFLIPFSLIYLNRDAMQTVTAEYEYVDVATGEANRTRLISSINHSTQSGRWVEFSLTNGDSESAITSSLQFKKNVLFIEDEMYMFTQQGFCWDSQDKSIKYKVCVDSVLQSYKVLPDIKIDSVFEYTLTYDHAGKTHFKKVLLSPLTPLVLYEEIADSIRVLQTKKITSLQMD